MTEPTPSVLSRISGWLRRLSLPSLAAFGVVLAGGVGAGGYYAHRTYDHVQHNNRFCLSCHPMEQPFQKLSKSTHRGLACESCHQPTFIARSSIALAQGIETPELFAVRSDVPNERCEACHVEGDPQKWRLIGNSAGHKAHLDPTDPRLEGIQCVTCHGASVHEFTPVDRTCAQAGCHEESAIQLGRMSNLTIHCAVCHSFWAPMDSVSSPQTRAGDNALLPNERVCLSCHAMRLAIELPDPDPHRGECAWCHNPHVQRTPQEAWKSCASFGCHTRPDTLTPFHRGLPPGVLERCQTCHKAHDFSLNGHDCGSCHKDVPHVLPPPPGYHREGMRLVPDTAMARPRPVPKTMSSAAPGGGDAGPLAAADLAFTLSAAEALPTPSGRWPSRADPLQATPTPAPVPQTTPQGPTFNHEQHRTVSCSSCHSFAGDQHGGLKIKTLQDCRSCHHTAPVADDCARCHSLSAELTKTYSIPQEMHFSIGKTVRRSLRFTHASHDSLDCSQCHRGGLDRSAEAIQCSSCHAQHHLPTSDCTVCHRQSPASAHPVNLVHATCTGSSCHKAPPFETPPRTRQGCLVCHQDQRAHQPGNVCADCHAVPAPRGG